MERSCATPRPHYRAAATPLPGFSHATQPAPVIFGACACVRLPACSFRRRACVKRTRDAHSNNATSLPPFLPPPLNVRQVCLRFARIPDLPNLRQVCLTFVRIRNVREPKTNLSHVWPKDPLQHVLFAVGTPCGKCTLQGVLSAGSARCREYLLHVEKQLPAASTPCGTP